MPAWIVLLLALCAATGCHRFEKKTSGQIGCPAKEIDIRKKKTHWTSVTWQAECRGRLFYCQERGGGEYSSAQVTCTESIGENDAGGEEPLGCQYDTQCKGERICVDHQCTDP